MALLVILAVMGAGYSLLTTAPKPVRQVELLAVWATLALIAVALLGTVNPAIALLLAGLIIAPLWYVTLRMCDQYARAVSKNTAQLWRDWRTSLGAPTRSPTTYPQGTQISLATRLDGFGDGQIVEEIEITQVPEDPWTADNAPLAVRTLELAPVEELGYRRGRIV